MTTGPDRDAVEVVFEQATARRRVEAVPLAHLSVELGHLYRRDYAAGADHLRRAFARVAPWARTAVATAPDARVSTCYLIDDYSADLDPPAVVVPAVLAAADANGLRIDYLSRESACVAADDAALAGILTGRLVAEPPPGTTGARPPATQTGWLCNGQRSPATRTDEAMAMDRRWTPPRQNAPDRHSVFVDVELWDERDGQRVYSCAFLSAVWQLLRLGLLRDGGRGVAGPRRRPDPWPDRWADLPPVVQLTDHPPPFAAYRTLSILDGRFLSVELAAVRTILDQVAVDTVVADQVAERARAEGVDLAAEANDRIRYVLL